MPESSVELEKSTRRAYSVSIGLKRRSIEIEYEPVTTVGVVLGWRSPPFSGNDQARIVGLDAQADALIVSVTKVPFTKSTPVVTIVPVALDTGVSTLPVPSSGAKVSRNRYVSVAACA